MAQRILLVDDDLKTRQIVGQALEDEGFVVSIAADGHAALQLLSENSFSLIATDLHMPHVTGWELLAEVRRQNINLPVMIITAMGDDDNREHAHDMGVADYITKPIDLDDLVKRIKERLRATATR